MEKAPPASDLTPPLVRLRLWFKAEPSAPLQITYLRREIGFTRAFSFFCFGELSFCFGGFRTKGGATIWEPLVWSPKIVKKRLGRHAGAACIFLWPIVRRQAETLQFSEITGGEAIVLHRAMKKPTLEQRAVEMPMLQLAVELSCKRP